MNKLGISIILFLSILTSELKSQFLVNVVNINTIKIEDNQQIINPNFSDEMLIAFNTSEKMIYKNSKYSYWVDFKLKQCGKKTKLNGTTYLLLDNGNRINGKNFSVKEREKDEGPLFIGGVVKDEFKIEGKESEPLKTSFKYIMRVTN